MAHWTDGSFEGEKNIKNKSWRKSWVLHLWTLMLSWGGIIKGNKDVVREINGLEESSLVEVKQKRDSCTQLKLMSTCQRLRWNICLLMILHYVVHTSLGNASCNWIYSSTVNKYQHTLWTVAEWFIMLIRPRKLVFLMLVDTRQSKHSKA